MREAELSCSSTFFYVAGWADVMCTADVPKHRLAELQTANVHLPPPFEEHQFDAPGELLSIAETDLPFTTDVILSSIQIDEGTSSRADPGHCEIRGDAD